MRAALNGELDMGVAGLGTSLGSIAMQYDFTKMTNRQLFNAVQTLGSEGKISQTDASQLSAIAQGVDSTPVDRSQVVSVAQILNDPTQHDFVAHLEDTSASMRSTPGSVGMALVDSMLKDLQTYQANAVADTGKSISIQA
jgi:hypothetical protein